MLQVKKYGNRRLYDTEASRYVTLEEIAERVRLGEDLKVVDAKSGQDLTQVTLAQIILESRGAARLLPVPLLKQLVRMRDDALAEFFGRYVTWALEVYLRLKQGARAVMPWNPLTDLAVPGLISAGIFAFTLSWNEFIYALTFVSSSENKTVPVGVVTELVEGDVYHWGSLMAGALLGSLPVAFIYSFFVEHYVSGLTGSVKE